MRASDATCGPHAGLLSLTQPFKHYIRMSWLAAATIYREAVTYGLKAGFKRQRLPALE